MNICGNCNKSFIKYKNHQKFCSETCADIICVILRKKNQKKHYNIRRMKKDRTELTAEGKIKMPKSDYNCENFDWEFINSFANKGNKYS